MNTTQYVAGLPAKLNKEDLIHNLQMTESLIQSLIDKKKMILKHVDKKVMPNQVAIRSKMVLKSDPISYFYKNEKNLILNMNIVEQKLKTLPDTISTGSATLDVLNVIIFVEAYTTSVSWLLELTRDLIKSVYLKGQKDNEDLVDELESEKSVVRNINEGLGKFIWAIKSITVSNEDVSKALSTESAFFINKSTETELKVSGKLNEAPLANKLADGFLGNPFYAIGSYMAAWTAHTHELASEELVQLELMLSDLERSGGDSVTVQKQLVILNERIADKRQLIKDLES